MMNSDPHFQAGHGWMVFSEPFLADFKCAGDQRLVVKQRVDISALA